MVFKYGSIFSETFKIFFQSDVGKVIIYNNAPNTAKLGETLSIQPILQLLDFEGNPLLPLFGWMTSLIG